MNNNKIKVETQICNRCDKEKPLDEFYLRENGKHRQDCKRCFIDKVKAKPNPHEIYEKDGIKYRKCTECLIDKELTEFYHRKDRDEYALICDDCRIKPKKTLQKVIDNKANGKTCSNCNIFKPLEDFYLNGERYATYCKDCTSNIAIEFRIDRHENLGTRACRICEKTKDAKYFGPCRPFICDKCIVPINRKKVIKHRETRRIRSVERRKTDIQYKLNLATRNRISKGLKGRDKSARTREIVGCDWAYYKHHIESQFEPWMNWQNWGYGPKKWVIDHIDCVELFDLTDKKQLCACFRFSNASPLGWKENNLKSDLIRDGRHARSLSPEEKLEYLKSIGYNF